MKTYPARLVQVSIARPATEVYAFASDPNNLSKWAAGLSQSPLHQEGEFWIADSPMGRVKIKFAPPNTFGVIDHDVTLPDGTTVSNPLRVQANGTGAEVIFTVYRMPKMSADDFAQDVARVQDDLNSLKAIIEKLP